MDPNESIIGMKGLVKAMPDLYGPNFDSVSYSPEYNNIRTGARMSKPHHCTHNDKAGHQMTRKCITQGHQAYCLEWITIDAGRRVRCGQRMKVESGGCGTHKANNMDDSNNLKLKNLAAGKLDSISWGELNDPERKDDGESQARPTAKQMIQAETDERLAEHCDNDEALDTVEDLPVPVYNTHVKFVEHKKAEDRSQAEQRKASAAARRTSVHKTMKAAASSIKSVFSSEPETAIDQKLRLGRSKGKITAKKGRGDQDQWKGKRGGKNASEFSG